MSVSFPGISDLGIESVMSLVEGPLSSEATIDAGIKYWYESGWSPGVIARFNVKSVDSAYEIKTSVPADNPIAIGLREVRGTLSSVLV